MGFHETILSDEPSRFEGYAAEVRELQARGAKKSGKPSRALHVKQHVGLVGELVVTAPEHLRTGVFASVGQRWPVYVRLSNGSGKAQSDRAPDARGFAIKLVGVPGKKIILGLESAQTQDFLFIAEPSIAFRDPEEFMSFVRAAKDGPLKIVPRLLASLGLRRGLGILLRLSKGPKVASMATHPFYTASPIAFGATAAKIALFPIGGSSANAPVATGPSALRDDFAARIRGGALSWLLKVQLFVDDATTPIEDTSVTWPSPWIEVGLLTIPAQDPNSPRGKQIAEVVDGFSFDPWHSIEEHRPLGAIMRARAVAYRESVVGRSASAEPESVLAL